MPGPRKAVVFAALLPLIAPAASLQAQTRDGLGYFSPDRREAQVAYEDALVDRLDPRSLRRWHDLLGSEPHRAGTPGDRRVIETLAAQFEQMGMQVETQWLDLYLCEPIDARLQIVAGTDISEPLDLAVREPAIEEDPFTRRQDFALGWNAFSGSGSAEAGVVYANHARAEDFARLAELGVSCESKIVIARYGGNYRGYKAKYAEQAGAAGLIIFTDPGDSGFGRGPVYPEGGYANEHYIQSGSILALDHYTDPLTPHTVAVADLDPDQRLDPDRAGLPTIPVQPIGYGAAEQILSRMTGREIEDETWQGGFDFPYRLEGGEDLLVSLEVEQKRGIYRTANVVGTIEGAIWPDEFVVIGGHHDSWVHGASDPLAGLICLMDVARVMNELAEQGSPPARSILFAGWAAEEYGIIGSSEWVMANFDRLRGEPGSAAGCVGYINLDMAAMGPYFNASSWPGFKGLIADAAKVVPQARDPEITVHELWLSMSGRGATHPRIGTLGGGSDHVGFLCHAGIPSISVGASGSKGVSYHSLYDTLAWYRQIVGEDYEPALMVARMAAVIASRLANADLLPTQPHRVIDEASSALLGTTTAQVPDRALGHIEALRERMAALSTALAERSKSMEKMLESGRLDRRALNAETRAIDLAWTPLEGLRQRPWLRNRFISPDATSGYASWAMPGVRYELTVGDARFLNRALRDIERVLDRVDRAVLGD